MSKRDMLSDVAITVIVGLAAACAGAENIPSASELIGKYTQALDSTSSFIADYEKTTEGSFRGGRVSHAGKYFSRGQLRYDNQRLYEYEYRWGDWASMTFTEDKPHYTIAVVNSEMNYQNTKRVGDRPGKAMRRPRPQGQNITLHAHFGVSYLAGYIGSDERLDAILRKADRIWVQEKTQKVGDSDCFVIEADTKCGRYKVWLDPEHGFHPAKLLHEAGEGDYSDRHLMAKGDSAKEYLKNVRFEKVGDVWVPMEADSGSDLRSAQGDFVKDNYHYKRTKIVLNPDHNKLGSFDDPLENPSNDPELTNGTRVLKNYLPIEYTWQDGELIPNIDELVIDQLDKMAEEIMAEKAVSDANGFSLAPSITTVSDLLGRYRATQDKLQSFIAKGESLIEYVNKTRQSSRKETEHCEFRFDGNRVNHRSTFWDGLLTTKDKLGYKSFLWDGKSFIVYRRAEELKNSRVFVKKHELSKKRVIATEYKGAALMGICDGDYDRIDLILGKAEKISLRDKTDKIEESDCFVIDAETKRGKYTVWLDPEHGYNIAKIEAQREKDDLVRDRESVKTGMSFSLENVRFEKIGDVWVPMEADMQQTTGGKKTKWHHKRTEVVLNPDHSALGSFVADDIPDGTKVLFPGFYDKTEYTWQNGKPVVEVDSNVKP